MRVASAVIFLIFLINCSLGQKKKKDDKQPRPAVISYSGCKLKEGALSECASVSNSDIQMGEAWANPRVHGQLFAVFVPYEPGTRNYDSEGGPYGIVTAWDCNPTEDDMEATTNPANWCMFWDGKDTGRKLPVGCEDPNHTGTRRKRRSDEEDDDNKNKKEPKSPGGKSPSGKSPSGKSPSGKSPSGKSPSGKSPSGKSPGGKTPGGKTPGGKTPGGKTPGGKTPGSGGGGGGGGSSSECPAPRPKAPGEEGLPMPIVCPSNLKDCYSADWYSPGGKLAKYANMKPTYEGVWFPLKNKSTHEPMFCKGLGLGCATPTMLELQLHKLGSVGCDVASCKEPPAAK